MMAADLQQLELAIRQQRVITRLRQALEQVPNHPYHDERQRLLLMLITAIDDQPEYHDKPVEIEQLETLIDQPAQVTEPPQPAAEQPAQPTLEQPAQDLRDIMKKGSHDTIA